jgi:hypothetical protein
MTVADELAFAALPEDIQRIARAVIRDELEAEVRADMRATEAEVSNDQLNAIREEGGELLGTIEQQVKVVTAEVPMRLSVEVEKLNDAIGLLREMLDD